MGKCNVEIPYILFADDEDSTLEIFKFYIDLYKWRADYVKTARAIITKVNDNCGNGEPCYDAIVADINYFNQEEGLPRLTGITAAAEIRKAHLNIPIVFVSAFSGYLIKEQVREVNAEIMPKPVNPQDLFDRLAQLIKWNRIATNSEYFGNNKRINAINRTSNNRRMSDKGVTIPDVIENALSEAREYKTANTKK